MSWSVTRHGSGKWVAAEIEGAMHREMEKSWHNEFSRRAIEGHIPQLITFVSRHTDDTISVTSSGHFAPNGVGDATVKCMVIKVGVEPLIEPLIESPFYYSDGVHPVLAVDHLTANTDAHSPKVEHGVTTPITPVNVLVRQRRPNENDDTEAATDALAAVEGVVGATITTTRALFIDGQKHGPGVIYTEPGRDIESEGGDSVEAEKDQEGVQVLTVGAGLLPTTEPTGSEGPEA